MSPRDAIRRGQAARGRSTAPNQDRRRRRACVGLAMHQHLALGPRARVVRTLALPSWLRQWEQGPAAETHNERDENTRRFR